MNIKYFFELLQIAVGNREQLSRPLSEEEWQVLYKFFKKHCLIGVGYVGITRMPQEQRLRMIKYSNWISNSEKTKQKNEEMTDKCQRLCRKLTESGFNCCVLKGQSNLYNYPDWLRDYRTPGDIDIWALPKGKVDIEKTNHGRTEHKTYTGRRGMIEYILMQHRKEGAEVMPEVNYHHVDWKFEDTEVEVHFRPSWMNSPIHNSRLQKWCEENYQWGTNDYLGIPIPTPSFNVVYQLTHVYRHLFNEGIGMRQILDYYMVIRKYQEENQPTKEATSDTNSTGHHLSVEELNQVIDHLGMKHFEAAIMWILHYAFGMPKEYLLCPTDEKRGRFLLKEILLAGNFGKSDKRNKIDANENKLQRFVRRQKRFLRFFKQYPSEVLWGPYFTFMQRAWRVRHGWR